MQISDEILKCVAFLAYKQKNGFQVCGTVFFVGYPLDDVEDVIAIYAVTARHVIEEIARRSDGNVYCRISALQNGPQHVPIAITEWLFHDDPRIDVAVAPCPFRANQIDHKFLPRNLFLDKETIATENIGIGDDLFFPGLFSQRPGENKNLPIVRIGNIAAMPDEPIKSNWGVLPSAYLVEARSIGGLSGSPVFWSSGAIRTTAFVGLGIRPPVLYLLGLVHGHYGTKKDVWDSCEEVATDSVETRSVNMGIAIVIPASDILSVLNRPEFQKQRDVVRQRILTEEHSITDILAEFTKEIIIQENTG